MSINPFDNLTQDGLEESGDFLGSGGPMESGVYDATIKMAYSGASPKGAKFVAVHLDIDGREHRETIYVTNRAGENFYTRDGKKVPLPGFTTANDLALLSTGQALSNQDFEEKVIKLYDFNSRQEVPTKVPAITSMIGKTVKVGLLKVRENKNKLNEQTNQYEPTEEERVFNSIDKVFHAESGKTVSEFTAKMDEASFLPKWSDKWTGQLRDKYKKVEGGSSGTGMPGASSGGTKTTSLFDGN